MSAPALDAAVIATLRQLNQPGEPDVVREVLTLFREDTPARIDAIVRAAAAGDAATMRRAAHTLKGSAASIGASEVHRLCRQIEDAAAAGALTQASSSIDQLQPAFDAASAAIDQLL